MTDFNGIKNYKWMQLKRDNYLKAGKVIWMLKRNSL